MLPPIWLTHHQFQRPDLRRGSSRLWLGGAGLVRWDCAQMASKDGSHAPRSLWLTTDLRTGLSSELSIADRGVWRPGFINWLMRPHNSTMVDTSTFSTYK